jgi:hypothetical protein
MTPFPKWKAVTIKLFIEVGTIRQITYLRKPINSLVQSTGCPEHRVQSCLFKGIYIITKLVAYTRYFIHPFTLCRLHNESQFSSSLV